MRPRTLAEYIHTSLFLGIKIIYSKHSRSELLVTPTTPPGLALGTPVPLYSVIPGHRWWEPRWVPGLEPYQSGEETGGRWARELVWALVWVGKRGARQGRGLL